MAVIEAAVISIIAGDGGNAGHAQADQGFVNDILDAIRALSLRVEEIAAAGGQTDNWPSTSTKPSASPSLTGKPSKAVSEPSEAPNGRDKGAATENGDGSNTGNDNAAGQDNDKTDDIYQEVLDLVIDEIMACRGMRLLPQHAARRFVVRSRTRTAPSTFSSTRRRQRSSLTPATGLLKKARP